MHRGPDGVLDAVAAPPGQQAGVDQLVEDGAELTQGRAVLAGPVVRSAVGVPLGHREGGGEPPRFVARKLQVRDTDGEQLEACAVADPQATVKADVERLLTSPLLSPKVSVSGHVYDIATGRVTTTVDARHPQRVPAVRAPGEAALLYAR